MNEIEIFGYWTTPIKLIAAINLWLAIRTIKKEVEMTTIRKELDPRKVTILSPLPFEGDNCYRVTYLHGDKPTIQEFSNTERGFKEAEKFIKKYTR